MTKFEKFSRRLGWLDRIKALPLDTLPQWWKDLLSLWRPSGEPSDDHGLRLAIRNEYMNFYRRGQSIARIKRDQNGGFESEIHIKYVDPSNTSRGNEYVTLHKGWILRNREQWKPYQGVGQLKEWIEVIDKRYAGIEKTFVDDVVAANPNIIDLEMGLPAWKSPKNAPRIDLVEIVTTAEGNRVVFWEAKRASDSRSRSETKPKVLAQLDQYRDFLSAKDRVDLVAEAYKNTAVLLVQLRSMADKLGEEHPLGPAIIDVAEHSRLTVDCEPRLVVLQDSPQETWAVHEKKLRDREVRLQVMEENGSRKLMLPD